MHKLMHMSVVKRSALLWVIVIAALFLVFEIAALTHPEAWTHTDVHTPEKGWNIFFFILVFNGLLIAFITGGNLFVRFGNITPGLIILFLQTIHIGWIAGTNSFIDPFPSVGSAHLAFLRIGLWEVTAYVLFCSATLDKSLYISDKFPAKEWRETRRFTDLHWDVREITLLILGIVCVVGAAAVEAFIG